MSTTDGWLKLNFASCVERKTRSLGALVLCSICNIMCVNYIYDMIVDTQFHKVHGRPFCKEQKREMCSRSTVAQERHNERHNVLGTLGACL